MSLPPFPTKDIGETDCQAGHSDESVQAYGQQCRAAALEEAARICHGIATAPSNVVLGVAMECYEKIRNLK